MKKVVLHLTILVCFLAMTGCMAKTPQEKCLPASIGSAKMLQDGTITLRLRGETGDRIAETYLEIKPNDPRYIEIEKHLGGIKPGEEKPVPPWNDETGKNVQGCSAQKNTAKENWGSEKN